MDIENQIIFKNYTFDDGLIYIQRNQKNNSIAVFLKNIDDPTTLTKEFREILSYISTYRPEK